ncbi:carboxylesterase family protein [Streptomyces sp. NPDC023588]|uniref:carboxylesterase family protein n=1 Tax=Streptomyces sp. NPDC023588 TaxID=3154907 RepID=UPI0033FC04EC
MPDLGKIRRWCVALLLPLVMLSSTTLPAGAAPGAERPVVDTDRGPVRGRSHGAYRTFEGIPFAAPPTGALRWRLPEPAPRWKGPRRA